MEDTRRETNELLKQSKCEKCKATTRVNMELRKKLDRVKEDATGKKQC